MQPPVEWVARDLGVSLGVASVAHGINERGQVVVTAGCSAGDGPCPAGAPDRLFLWQNGKLTEIGDGDVVGSALNTRGEVIGNRSRDSVRHSTAFSWKNGRITWLGKVGGASSYASAINARGQIVGQIQKDNGHARGFVWRAGRMTEIGPLPGRTHSAAYEIDDRGTVLGESWSDNPGMPDSTKDHTLFVWRNGKTIELGDDPAPPLFLRSGRAVWHADGMCGGPYLWEDGRTVRVNPGQWNTSCVGAINDKGEVAGQYGLETVSGFLWRNGRTTSFRLPGPSSTYAIALNNRGQLAITAIYPFSPGSREHYPRRAYVRRNGRVTPLPTLGGLWSSATAINDAGEVVGWSTTKSGVRHAVLWTHR